MLFLLLGSQEIEIFALDFEKLSYPRLYGNFYDMGFKYDNR